MRMSDWSSDVCSSDLMLLVGLIAFAAAIAGVFVGRMVTQTPGASETELHALLHSQLALTAQQEARIERTEADFTGRRHALEQEMRADNVRLAQAIEAEQGSTRKGLV